MPDYIVRITLQGHADKDVSTLTFSLGTLADETAAQAAITAIQTPLAALTDAVISRVSMETVILDAAGKPVYGVDVHDEARVTMYLDALGGKKWTTRIPAPVSTLVLADGYSINTGDADLIAYAAALAANAEVSDGESVNTTVTNGIASGKVASKAKTY